MTRSSAENDKKPNSQVPQHPFLPLKDQGWLSPFVYFSNNWLSLAGVVLVTTSTIFWLFLLPATLEAEVENPYLGIVAFLILPVGFFGGLALVPLGIFLRLRKQLRRGKLPRRLPPLDLHNVQLRRLLIFIGVTTFANLVIGSQFTYRALNYMDGVAFCGLTCHKVMHPEYTAYQNSPHSRVACVDCHIGAGASWFVKSKFSGVAQLFATSFDTYPRPIPAPVANLRPARETCETCHWPQKFGEDRLRIISRFAEDEHNTMTKTVLLMRIGGGGGGPGIHSAHLGEGVLIRYADADDDRRILPWVESFRNDGPSTVYVAPDTEPEDIARMTVREMDCMDCHNRPTHAFDLPERALDKALASGNISAELPFVRKQGMELLTKEYASSEEALRSIPEALADFYRESYPDVHKLRVDEIERAAESLLAIYNRNVFPDMKITWGTYANNIGHTDFPGCFRCHDDLHADSTGETISQDCSTCHQLLAMEEEAPQILFDLGLLD